MAKYAFKSPALITMADNDQVPIPRDSDSKPKSLKTERSSYVKGGPGKRETLQVKQTASQKALQAAQVVALTAQAPYSDLSPPFAQQLSQIRQPRRNAITRCAVRVKRKPHALLWSILMVKGWSVHG